MGSEEELSWVIHCADKVCAVEFSPFHWSSTLLAVGTTMRATIFQCKFKEEDPEVDNFLYETVREFNLGSTVHVIAWSPETSLHLLPQIIKFAAAGGDKNIRLINSNVTTEDSVTIFEGHGDCINSLAFEPENGTILASTSDDYTCRIWNLDGTMKICLTLNSPGMSVCWHKNDSGKIMVAQKNGIIRFYNLNKEQPIMSLDCHQSPLMAADWCPANNLKVGGVASSSWFMWDISRSSQPQDNNQMHMNGAVKFKWSLNNENVFASTGRPKNEIKVFNYKQNQLLLNTTIPVGSGITWHSKLSVLAVVGDKKIHIWKLSTL